MPGPIVTDIKRHGGIAGQYEISATVTYPGEPAERVAFVGSVYGGPVVAISPSGRQVFVSREVMDKCGPMLDVEWVRKFYA